MSNRGSVTLTCALLPALAAALAAVAGCGQPYDDLLGVWQVTAHTDNQTGCEAEGPPVVDPPFIKFVEGEFFGQEYAQYVACTTPATCEDPGGLFGGLLYAEEIDGGVRAVIYSASGSPADCLLAATVSDATVVGGALTIETRRRSQDNVTDSSCDADDAQARAASLPCDGYEVIEGARP